MKVLNEIAIRAIFHNFYKNDFKDVNIKSLQLADILHYTDGYNFFTKGDLVEYLIEPFKYNQPKTYLLLKNSVNDFFYAIKKTTLPAPIGDDFTQFGILINDIAIYIKYTRYSNQNNSTIPLGILNSWLLHSSGWDIAEGVNESVFKGSLPSMKLMPMHSIIADFDKKQNHTKYCDFLEDKFNSPFVRDYQDDFYNNREKYFELRCLLDTRLKNDYSKTGFQLFVSSHNKERNVYVVPNADVFQIKQLENPADAIDSYAEHIFLKKEGEFDFMQYAKDF